ncbi:hypothetical protein DFJ73DRAFT_828483, partial [Zopfochytrium polystomum]
TAGEDEEAEEDYDLEEGELVDAELRTLLIEHLAPKTTSEILMDSFGVLAASVIKRPRRVTLGLVEFLNPSHARKALRDFAASSSPRLAHPKLGKVRVRMAPAAALLPHPAVLGLSEDLGERGGSGSSVRKLTRDQATQTEDVEQAEEEEREEDLEDVDDVGVALFPSGITSEFASCLSVLKTAADDGFLYIPLLPLEVTSKDLVKLFASYTFSGEKCFAASFERNDESTRFGVVAYSSASDALTAQAAVQGTDPFDTNTSIDVENPSWRKALRVCGLPASVNIASILGRFQPFGKVKAVRAVSDEAPVRADGDGKTEEDALPEKTDAVEADAGGAVAATTAVAVSPEDVVNNWKRFGKEVDATGGGDCVKEDSKTVEPKKEAGPAEAVTPSATSAEAENAQSGGGHSLAESEVIVEYEREGCAIRAFLGLVGKKLSLKGDDGKWLTFEIYVELI